MTSPFVNHPVQPPLVPAREPSDDRWPDWLAGGLLAYSTFILVIAVVPSWHRYFADRVDLVSALLAPAVPSLVYGALVFVLAIGVRRRLRAAWWILLVWWILVPQAGRLLAIWLGDRPVANGFGLLIVGGLMVVVLRSRPQFPVRRVAGNLRNALAVLFVGGAAVVAVGAALVTMVGRTSGYGASAAFVLDSMLTEVGRIGIDSDVTAPWWVRLIVGIGGSLVVLSAATLLFRAPRDTRIDIPGEAAVRTLLRDFGEHDSLGYFATRRDKSIVWDSGNPTSARAGISYRTIGSVCLASGNPVGDPTRWPAAIDSWLSLARERGWSVAVMGAGLEGARAYADAGLTMLDIGDEAIVDLTAFSLGAVGMKEIRRSVVRLRDLGYTTRVVRHGELTADDFDTLGRVATRWRGDGGDERGFSMALGRLGDPLDSGCVLVEAFDAAGRLRGFLSFVPWGRSGLSLDLMRRDPTADNGLIELMVAGLADSAATFGVGRVSLNFAMFREAFERGAEIGAGPVARLWRKALLFASRSWQLESLYRSNAKYLPLWEPRYIGYEFTSDLLRVGTAAGSAEGFLAAPSVARFRGRGATPEHDTLSTGGAEHAAAVLALIGPAPDPLAEALTADRLPDQLRVRRAKLDRLRREGIDPYPVHVSRSHTLAEVRAAAGEPLGPDAQLGLHVSVAGRIMSKRDFGGLGFATLRDASGDLQVMVDLGRLGSAAMRSWRRDLDLGDLVGVTGDVLTTHTGELSVRADEPVTLVVKSLRPLPGTRRTGGRMRRRYVDLAVRPEARRIAAQRSAVVRSLRESLHRRGFDEVETPVLQTVHGGANARPFETHLNALGLDLTLRIATELHLKRLLVGGMERIYEIGRQFRNEGIDLTHNPEFTSLEVYEAYGDEATMRQLTQELVQAAAVAVHGRPIAVRRQPDGSVLEYDLSGDWPVRSLCDAVSAALGEQVTADTSTADLLLHAKRLGRQFDLEPSWGAVLEDLYTQLCEQTTTTPVFYTHFPRENAPLARPDRHDPRFAEKWDLVMFGSELATAYSELNDPVEQRARLVAQSLRAAAGDPEAMVVDEDFLTALEYGMPPTGGMGLGVDRLVMNLTGLTIRDVILFPLAR